MSNKFRWDNPFEWLLDNAHNEWDKERVFTAIVKLADKLSFEEIESIFKKEMDKDGYFDYMKKED